jgi:hypothetical protein
MHHRQGWPHAAMVPGVASNGLGVEEHGMDHLPSDPPTRCQAGGQSLRIPEQICDRFWLADTRRRRRSAHELDSRRLSNDTLVATLFVADVRDIGDIDNEQVEVRLDRSPARRGE